MEERGLRVSWGSPLNVPCRYGFADGDAIRQQIQKESLGDFGVC